MLVLPAETGEETDNPQNMSRRQNTTPNPTARMGILNQQGHQLAIDANTEHVTITITRREGYAHHITITPDKLPDQTRNGAAYARHPQSVLIAAAINAIADWSEQQDRGSISPCIGCGQTNHVGAFYNKATSAYEWFCPGCFHGETT